MQLQRNISLKKYTTFRIGGPAKYFWVAKNKKELIKAIKFAKKHKLPFFILGEGSNVLVSDQGYQGLVIKFQTPLLSKFVDKGLEWAAGIPGTVGGAIRGNAGAFDGSMADVVKNVEVLDARSQKIKIFKNKDCKFGYRTSIFKKNPNLIIFSCELRFKPGDKRKIKEKIEEHLNYRKARHPQQPSAGSIFKNPRSFSARELIDRCDLGGKKIGRAQISKKHANFVVNLGGAKAKDVLALINLIKKEVKNKFGIKLEEEIQYLGF